MSDKAARWIKALFAMLATLARDAAGAWRVAWRTIGLLVERCRTRMGWSEHERNRDPAPCTPIRRPEFRRPDPLIYAQFHLMALGYAVTWDNPDISLETPGAPQGAPPDPARTVPSGALAPDTEYDIVARIWNGSPSAPVVGLKVHFGFLAFGIGMVSTFVGTAITDLGVKGGPGSPAFARMRWRTPAAPGHYCVQVLLDWFDDLNPANNYGQENTQVGSAQSPAHFSFRLGNRAEERQTFHFEVDNFAIAAPPACDRVDRAGEAARRNRQARTAKQPPVAGRPETFPAPGVRPGQRREAHPLPEGWRVRFDPERPTLAAGDEVEVRVAIEPPDGFRGRMPVNVHAFGERGLAGGVTLTVEKA